MRKLDELIKLMGEVVSSHARLRQRTADLREIERADGALSSQLREFAHVLKDDVLAQELLMEELHSKALVMRMLPLAMVFESAPRMVRDLARSVGKEVECSVSGTEIELDRQLIDRLGDPIVHLLRNAVDHGIETPEARQQAGKPKGGQVHLNARQDSGSVVIEIGDDGGGIALSAIRDKAVRKGLMTADQAAALSETEVIDLIFLPGFSTNAIITDVSGRGVGMDVVKRCIVDELQGTIDVETRPGLGTTFVLRLPLSLAVMRVLLVEAGNEIFGFTAQQVAQLLRLPEQSLMTVAERAVAVVHNEFIPVVDLATLLSLPTRPADANADLLLVVVQVRNDKLALRVDTLIDERDMVIKPLPDHLSHLTMVSGMVMTGRNALVSVLHAPVLLDMARQDRADTLKTAIETERKQNRVLVVDDSLNTREIERDVLEAYGYQVTLAEDGRDGLQKALGGQFDAVLTDVEMPNMDGFALTSALREDERTRHIPIIIITSRQKEEDKRRGVQVGADAYIVKGDFDQSGLISTLKSLLG
jgi:chemotaxis protein histidine kinase CheA